ncbi:hypothetical protein CGRA01v4_13064 [Colletotrichum graminicola]|nr:hypothetical protein CGRA01v4_13064 [Colletotrichum graminicola]
MAVECNCSSFVDGLGCSCSVAGPPQQPGRCWRFKQDPATLSPWAQRAQAKRPSFVEIEKHSDRYRPLHRHRRKHGQGIRSSCVAPANGPSTMTCLYLDPGSEGLCS